MIRFLLFLMCVGWAQAKTCGPVVINRAEVRGLYVSAVHTIVGNNVLEDRLLQFAVEHDFNYLVLYGVKTLLTVPASPASTAYTTNRQELGSFIRKAHEFYGLEIGVNVSSAGAAAPILDFLDWPLVVFDPLMRFDALHYESEYWNGSVPWATWAATLAWLYGECTDEGLLCEVYIGNPTHDTGPSMPNAVGQAEVDFMVTHADRIQVTYYRPDPYTPSPSLYHDRLWRLHYLANAVGPARVVVLLNARNSAEPNMNLWLKSLAWPMTTRLFEPYNVWRNSPHGHNDNLSCDTDALGLPIGNLEVLGYSWYRYQDLWAIAHPILKRAHGHSRRARRHPPRARR